MKLSELVNYIVINNMSNWEFYGLKEFRFLYDYMNICVNKLE